MSYDLAVFASRALSNADLRSFVEGSSGLNMVSGGRLVEVVRGARRRYCFTIGGPDKVEAEDVPTGIASVVLSPVCCYESGGRNR